MKHFLLGLLMGLSVLSCATRSYQVYNLRYRQGRLNDLKDSSKDLPISVCDDTIQSKANCYVLLRADYIKFRSDFIEIQQQLAACQKGK